MTVPKTVALPLGYAPIGDGGPGPITGRLRTALIEIQRGRAPDAHGWVHRLF